MKDDSYCCLSFILIYDTKLRVGKTLRIELGQENKSVCRSIPKKKFIPSAVRFLHLTLLIGKRKIMIKKYVLLIQFLLTVSASNAQQVIDGDQLHQYLNIQQQRLGFNGVVMVSSNGRTVFADSIGQASLELGVPLSTKSVFRLASISKSFTATLTLLAINEGKFTIQDSLAKFFPQLKDPQWRKITIDQLLSHRSGIPHNEGIEDYWKEKSTIELSRGMALKEIFSLKLAATPGTESKYSSPGYFLLASILENTYAKSYGDLILEKICIPLQLSHTGQLNNSKIIPHLVSPYQLAEEMLTMAPYRSFSLMKGSGDLYASAGDLLRFANSFGNGKWPLKLEKEMFAAHSEEPVGHGDLYGYGWFIKNSHEEIPKAYYHGGGSFGVSTLVAFYPEEKLAIALLCNVAVLPVNEIWADLEKMIFGKPFAMPLIRKNMTITTNEIKSLPGNYVSDNGMQLQVISQSGKLYAKLGNNPLFEIFCEEPMKYYGKKVSIDFIFEEGADGKANQIKAMGMGKLFSFSRK